MVTLGLPLQLQFIRAKVRRRTAYERTNTETMTLLKLNEMWKSFYLLSSRVGLRCIRELVKTVPIVVQD